MRAKLLSTAAVLLALAYPAMAAAQDKAQDQAQQQQNQTQAAAKQQRMQGQMPHQMQSMMRQQMHQMQQIQQKLQEAEQALAQLHQSIQQAMSQQQGRQATGQQGPPGQQGQADQETANITIVPADEEAEVAVVEEQPAEERAEAAATEEQSQPTEQQAAVEPQPQQEGDIDTEQLIGMTAQTPQGEDLGEIGDLVLTEQGDIEAAVIEVGGFLGIGEKQVAVDWNKVEVSPKTDQVVVNMTREELEAAPEYQATGQQQQQQMLPQQPEPALPDAGQ